MDDLAREEIEYALRAARSQGFTTVKLKKGETSFSATLGEREVEEADEVSVEPTAPKEFSVMAPAVGYFRAGPASISAGQRVSQGEKVGEIVALGIPNDVTSPADGIVKALCVEEREAVEYGQAIMTLEAL